MCTVSVKINEDQLRGYNPELSSVAAISEWVQQYPHVYDMILHEFDLPPERTTAKYAIHWDIGQTWR